MPEPATAKKQITTELSSRQVSLGAGQTTAVFYATVYNDSDRFASFQLKLLAAGAMADVSKSWYRLTPSVSSKIPAGDCVRFQVEVFDLPPIAQQFRGAIDLTVEVTSRELNNQYDRQPLRLLAEGFQGTPPALTLIPATLQANPTEQVAIVAEIHNPTQSALEVTLRLQDLPDRWFPEGTQHTLSLLAGKAQKVTFECQLPAPTQTLSQIYPFNIEATGQFPKVIAAGKLHILPAGKLIFDCDPVESTIPEELGRWQNPAQGTAEFALQIDNQSNLEPGVQITVKELRQQHRWFWQKADPDIAPDPDILPEGICLAELPSAFPIGLTTIPLQIQRRLPWLGWARLRRFEVKAQSIDPAVPVADETQTLQVHLFPVIPLWQQLLGTFLAVGLGVLTWNLLSDPGHRGPVNSVQFSGQGTEVLSGSSDQTIRRWWVRNRNLDTQNRIGGLEKAVRVVKYRPVNNDQVALGFENGEIQLANLLTGQRSRLSPDKDDRVFELAFSRDARTLYSGHGSGLVLQWDVNDFVPEQATPERAYNTQFAIEAMTLVGNLDSYLAIGGRYNRLLLLKLNQDKQDRTPQSLELTSYPFMGSSTDYISSLGTAEQKPNLLAVADTQGHISVWDVQTCLLNRGNCDPIDEWSGNSNGAVRAVAMSTNSCFLASTGDDGQVKLWSLTGQGERRDSVPEGRVLARFRQPLNAVDIIQTRDSVLVTSGGDDGQVRLHRVRLNRESLANDRCPVLVGDE